MLPVARGYRHAHWRNGKGLVCAESTIKPA
jgi:hypothetical protein